MIYKLTFNFLKIIITPKDVASYYKIRVYIKKIPMGMSFSNYFRSFKKLFK
jgi:hypothetical protein